jgi:hypothetical protein
MKSFPKQLVVVDVTVDPKVEEEWSVWYDQVHLPDILGCPGFIHTARYVCDEAGARRYPTVYEVTGDEVLESAEFSKRRGWGPFKEYVRSSVRTCRQISASRGNTKKQ